MKHLLLGDEAIAQGAIDAGLSGVYAYPGTPSTEITEFLLLSGLPGKKIKNCVIISHSFSYADNLNSRSRRCLCFSAAASRQRKLPQRR